MPLSCRFCSMESAPLYAACACGWQDLERGAQISSRRSTQRRITEQMAGDKRFRLLAILWVAGLVALMLGGGFNLVVGNLALSPASARANSPQYLPAPPGPTTVASPELATFMGHLQKMTHKLNLSLVAENPGLSAFYLHEVEEVLEQVLATFPTHDGFPVGDMVSDYTLASLDPLSAFITSGDWIGASRSYVRFVDSCNSCHEATGHGFIKVNASSANPFNQNFDR